MNDDRYQVLYLDDLSELVSTVNTFMAHGWKPVGGLVVISGGLLGLRSNRYAQAMMRV